MTNGDSSGRITRKRARENAKVKEEFERNYEKGMEGPFLRKRRTVVPTFEVTAEVTAEQNKRKQEAEEMLSGKRLSVEGKQPVMDVITQASQYMLEKSLSKDIRDVSSKQVLQTESFFKDESNSLVSSGKGKAPVTHPELSYDIHIDPSAMHISPEVIRTFTEENEAIREVNSVLGKAHTSHIERSQQAIVQTAKVALDRAPQGQPKKALLLGVGNAFDIPLRELAEQFDHLTLVELDRKSAQNAIEQLPLDIQKKINLIVADITGINNEYQQQINTALHESSSATDFLKSATEITNNTKATGKAPNTGNDYIFVCSQLVLSQLGTIPFDHIEKAVESRFGVQLSFSGTDITDPGFSVSHQNLTNDLHREHIQYLAKSVTRSGTVHFADTYEEMVYSHGKAQPDIYPTEMRQEFVDQVIEENFKPIEEKPIEARSWIFNHTPGIREFKVISHALETKEGVSHLGLSFPEMS